MNAKNEIDPDRYYLVARKRIPRSRALGSMMVPGSLERTKSGTIRSWKDPQRAAIYRNCHVTTDNTKMTVISGKDFKRERARVVQLWE